jgi:DNA-binding NarL/FixJ family response regulator
MSEKRRNRSDQYQSLFHESSCSHDMLDIFPNDASIHDRLTGGFCYDESVLELEDELKDEFWNIVNTLLTDRQKEVIKLYSTGMTQMEVAAQLGVNQSSG